MSVRNLTPGTAVRLSFDTGPASVGYVLDVLDQVRLRLEFPSETGTEHGEYIDGRVSQIVMPHTVLVAVCEWVDVFADEWGLACSEPGVPTSMSIPCHHDATTTAWLRDPETDTESPMNLCPEHTTESLRDALGLPSVESRREPIA